MRPWQHTAAALAAVPARHCQAIERADERPDRQGDAQACAAVPDLGRDNANKAVALLGVAYHRRGDDLIGELVWMTGKRPRAVAASAVRRLNATSRIMSAARSSARCAGRAGRQFLQAARLPRNACDDGKGALMGGSSAAANPVTQQTQQTSDPWSPAQPHLIEAMNSRLKPLSAAISAISPIPGRRRRRSTPYISNAACTALRN